MALMIARSATAPRRRRAGCLVDRQAPERLGRGEDLDVEVAVEAGRAQQARRAARGASRPRRGARGPVRPRRALSATWKPGDARGSAARPPAASARRVPDVHRVDHHADVVEPGLVEQRDRVADRREERRLARLREVRRLEAEPDARGARGRGHLAQPVASRARAPRPRSARPPVRVRHDDRGRLEARQARHARAQRLDALGRIGRALHAGQRELQERGDRGHAVGDAEAALAQQPRRSPRHRRRAA